MRALLFGLALLALGGCSTMKIDDFTKTTPVFDLESYFSGHTRAWGMFEDGSGNIKRQFTVDIHGYHQDGEFVLDESFVYNDGEKQSRTWRIRNMGEGRYEGRAGDVIGVAEGVQRGQALNWRYKLELPFNDGTIAVDFEDWMLLQPDDVLLNRAKVSKFGFGVGQVTLFFQRKDAPINKVN